MGATSICGNPRPPRLARPSNTFHVEMRHWPTPPQGRRASPRRHPTVERGSRKHFCRWLDQSRRWRMSSVYRCKGGRCGRPCCPGPALQVSVKVGALEDHGARPRPGDDGHGLRANVNIGTSGDMRTRQQELSSRIADSDAGEAVLPRRACRLGWLSCDLLAMSSLRIADRADAVEHHIRLLAANTSKTRERNNTRTTGMLGGGNCARPQGQMVAT